MKLKLPPLFRAEAESFENYVMKCAESNSPDQIHNASIHHAQIIVRELFKSAAIHKEGIRIVSGCLQDDFYRDDLALHAEEALRCGSRIQILVLERTRDHLASNELFRLVHPHPRGEVITPDSAPTPGAIQTFWAHFILVGDSRYRIEKDDGRKDAIASFNDRALGEVLMDTFAIYSAALA